MSSEKKIVLGLKRLTRANSNPLRLAKGGKHFIHDTSKHRKYKVPGENGYGVTKK